MPASPARQRRMQRLRLRLPERRRGRSAPRARRGRSSCAPRAGSAAPRMRPARAIAAIIRPFHDVSTLSSSGGRGRRLRASSSTGRARATHVDDVVDRPADARGDVLDRRRRVEQVLAGELPLRIERRVAARLEAEAQRHDARVRLAEQRLDLALRPDVERALGGVRARLARRLGRDAVGVLGRIEAAAGVGQVAIDVVERVVGDRGVEARSPAACDASRQREHELRLVVEHLLEVRHAPARVDRVAMEAAADVIAHAADAPSRAASRATMSRARRSPAVARTRASRKSSSDGRGNFGAPPKPPKRASKALRELIAMPSSRASRPATRRAVGRRRRPRRSTARERARSTSAPTRQHLRPLVAPDAARARCSTSTKPGRPQRAVGGK